MQQRTLADVSEGVGFERYHKTTRRERFLKEMEAIIPWGELVSLIEPHYPRLSAGQAGRRPVGVERLLRIHFIQHWYNLADQAVEEAVCDSLALRRFVGIDLGKSPVPDETTICRFRHLLERHGLGARIFEAVNRYLGEHGKQLGRGTIVDATIIKAPSSTKNKAKRRDPAMRSTKKGNHWYFGMKAHIGVDSRSKQIHSVSCTAANVHDSTQVKRLLHGKETRLYGDSAYTGKKKEIRSVSPKAKDFTNRRGTAGRKLSDDERAVNKRKSSVRAKVEHPFLILKRQFGFRKVRFRGLEKNTNHLMTSFALVNIVLGKKALLRSRCLAAAG